MKKLKLKTPEVIESRPELMVIGAGILIVVAIILYKKGVFNGPGRVIEASDRFTRPGGDVGAKGSDTGDKK